MTSPCVHCNVKDTCESKPDSGVAHLSSALEVEIKRGEFFRRIVAGICEEANHGVAHDQSYLGKDTNTVVPFMRLEGLETVSIDLDALQPAIPVPQTETENLRNTLKFLDNNPTSEN